MTIIRAPRKQRDFTILSNSVCLDPRLSMRSLGLLVRLLCRPDDWQTNSDTLAREFGCGRDQMRATLRELADSGYMQLRKSRAESGLISSRWYVFDEPQQPGPEIPDAGQPGPGKPYSGESGPIPRTDLPSTNTPPTPMKGEVVDGFNAFWTIYPKKVGKDAAEKSWNRKVKTKATTEEVMAALKAHTKNEAWARDGGKYIPNPATWLNQGRWKDELAGEAAGSQDWSKGAV